MTITVDHPLLSIGLPTYNRPLLLRRALQLLTTQTYRNLEIIVSDNASPGEESRNIVAEFMAKDQRITYYRQSTNIGAHNNFFFVFGKASGDFYMWAADDDQWEPWFVERCVEALLQTPERAAAITEVQYVGPELPYPFFSEGHAFYKNVGSIPDRDALLHLIDNNYGNLIYSVFRRGSLVLEDTLFWASYGLTTSNEIPQLLYTVLKGGFIVLPEIGMYKEVPVSVYRQAMWEFVGGWLPKAGRVHGFNSIFQTWKYHVAAFNDIEKGVALIPIDDSIRNVLLIRVKQNFIKHFFWMLLGYKPPRNGN